MRTESSSSGASGNHSSGTRSGSFRFAEVLALAGGIGAIGITISQGFVPHEWMIHTHSCALMKKA